MNIINLTADNFDDTIGNGQILVDFWADWCMPCRMVSPIIENLASEYEGKMSVAKVDIDRESALASRYSIMSIPTVILFKDGLEAHRFIGAQPKEAYTAILNSFFV